MVNTYTTDRVSAYSKVRGVLRENLEQSAHENLARDQSKRSIVPRYEES